MEMAARNFSHVLDELGGIDGDASALSEARARVSADLGFVVTALGPQKPAPQQKGRWYGEIPEKPEMAPRLTLPELEVKVGKAASPEELRRLRRQFARFNHPDQREDTPANAEMAAANQLIDKAIAAFQQQRREA
jgi:hypothetical protein